MVHSVQLRFSKIIFWHWQTDIPLLTVISIYSKSIYIAYIVPWIYMEKPCTRPFIDYHLIHLVFLSFYHFTSNTIYITITVSCNSIMIMLLLLSYPFFFNFHLTESTTHSFSITTTIIITVYITIPINVPLRKNVTSIDPFPLHVILKNVNEWNLSQA